MYLVFIRGTLRGQHQISRHFYYINHIAIDNSVIFSTIFQFGYYSIKEHTFNAIFNKPHQIPLVVYENFVSGMNAINFY